MLPEVLPYVRCSTQVEAGGTELKKLQWQLALLPLQVPPALSCYNCFSNVEGPLSAAQLEAVDSATALT